ncbi:MAG: hypothetical protein AAF647_01975 [Pseudomonadota bacterium]
MRLGRISLVWAAGAFALLAFGLELGMGFATRFTEQSAAAGLAIPALALVDGLLLWLVITLVTSTVMPAPLHSKVRALLTPFIYLAALILALVALTAAILKLVLMLSLLVALPFGPLVYLAVFGSFATNGVTLVIGVVTLLRAGALICLFLSSWRYLKNKTLVFTAATGFVCGLLVGLVFALLPGLLHSVGDAILAIVFSIFALIWALIMFIRSIPTLLSLIRI